jgi:hypothetical protein
MRPNAPPESTPTIDSVPKTSHLSVFPRKAIVFCSWSFPRHERGRHRSSNVSFILFQEWRPFHIYQEQSVRGRIKCASLTRRFRVLALSTSIPRGKSCAKTSSALNNFRSIPGIYRSTDRKWRENNE